VTDLSSQAQEDFIKPGVIKSISAVSVHDLHKCRASPPNICSVCHKPFQQEISYSLQFWREQMFDWACMVADSYGIVDRSGVVALSFSLLDRYVTHEMASSDATEPITRDDFQLLSMATLYISVKLIEGSKLTIDALVMMSRGFYKAQDIVVTEQEILTTLNWRLNAPTAIAFCRLMWTVFIPDEDSEGNRDRRQWGDLENCCATLTEIAVADASFLSYKTSAVALAAVALAARLRGISEGEIEQFVWNLQDMVETGGYDSEFQRVYRHLERVYCQ
jgi:hypothetical protein